MILFFRAMIVNQVLLLIVAARAESDPERTLEKAISGHKLLRGDLHYCSMMEEDA